MAWLARSIANSLKLDDDDDDEKRRIDSGACDDHGRNQLPSPSPSQSQSQSQSPRGMKEDLSELTKTLRSQFWGVASFLAPPPASADRPERVQMSDHLEENRTSPDHEESEEDLIAGIRNDFAEIGGRFRTEISKLSGNIAVSEFTKIASNFLQLGSEESNSKDYDVGDAIGVTEEVVVFARDLAMHPETWLDFPLPDEDDNFDDFDMTDAQQEHALAVERLASRLATLRIELCPGYMSEGCFWRIYFVLLHPKLSKDDALLLSTPQVLEARALLSHELQKRNKAAVQAESSESTAKEAPANVERLCVPSNPPSVPVPLKTISVETIPSADSSNLETEKHPVESKEIHVIDKSVIEEKPAHHDKPQNPPTASSDVIDVKVEDDADDWLKDEDTSGSISASGAAIPLGNDEDVSFSDLEEDDGDVPISYKKVTSVSDSSAKHSPEWVQLKDVKPVTEKRPSPGQVSDTKESNDWLDVDDIDVM